jgi:hypothetical protein
MRIMEGRASSIPRSRCIEWGMCKIMPCMHACIEERDIVIYTCVLYAHRRTGHEATFSSESNQIHKRWFYSRDCGRSAQPKSEAHWILMETD